MSTMELHLNILLTAKDILIDLILRGQINDRSCLSWPDQWLVLL